ncbi:putative inner membrane protein [Kluyvera cryocrescens]|uniref:Putative inner membrane protein n=1 Tax=Kluyvera cryocrescens TaxID=580 RepID=A0A485BX89_KLUCR|nr:putative inner membrane protein [Kluyvera cryocrescens]
MLGIFIGSFIAAKASREFRVRAADASTTLRSAGGGVLMGFGASIAGGCSIGNGLVMTAMMTWQGLDWPRLYDPRRVERLVDVVCSPAAESQTEIRHGLRS